MTKAIKIVAREVVKTKEIELFYLDNRLDLVCVNFREVHSKTYRGYYLNKTRKLPEDRE